jgi:hypothetical protein
MRMILLILGWHLTLVGVLAVILGLMDGWGACLVFGVGAFVVGLLMSITFRKACSNLKSDASVKDNEEVPLDYY